MAAMASACEGKRPAKVPKRPVEDATSAPPGVQAAQVTVASEPPGSHCALGGRKVEASVGGQAATSYVCNVAAGDAATLSLTATAWTVPSETFVVAGLEWQAEPSAEQMDWLEAVRYCRALPLASGRLPGRRWRLPEMKEMVDLFTRGDGVEPGGTPRPFWSSSVGSQGYPFPIIVNMAAGVVDMENKDWRSAARVRCVR